MLVEYSPHPEEPVLDLSQLTAAELEQLMRELIPYWDQGLKLPDGKCYKFVPDKE